MGIYSQYGVNTLGEEVVADESYAGVEGCMRAVTEAYENEHAIFNALIGVDFAEAYNKVNEFAVTESQVEAITEGTLGTIWSKVVEFIKKVWAKIKGLFKDLIDRVKMMFTRDGKALVAKYEKKAITNIRAGKTAKIKVKWSDSLQAPDPSVGDVNNIDLINRNGVKGQGNANHTIKLALNAAMNADRNSGDYINDNTDPDSAEDVKAALKNLAPYTTEDREGIIRNAYTNLANESVDNGTEYKKLVLAKYEEKLEDKEGITEDMLNTAATILKGYGKFVTDLEKNAGNADNQFKDALDKATKLEKAAKSAVGKKDASYNMNGQRAGAWASRVITLVGIAQNVIATYVSAKAGEAKKTYSLARILFVKAANATGKKYEATDEAVIEDASNYEVEAMFEGALTESILF